MSGEVKCCLTGHRPKGLPWKYREKSFKCFKFKRYLKKVLTGAIKYGLKEFYSGMAEGFDMIATEMLCKLQKKFKFIKIIAVLPCENQTIKWNNKQQKKYNRLLKKCDKIIVLSKNYYKGCMQDRNKFMVDMSQIVISCYGGGGGGTAITLKYAETMGLKIRNINPYKYKK